MTFYFSGSLLLPLSVQNQGTTVIPTSLGCCEAKLNLSSSALRSTDRSVASIGIQTLYKNTEWREQTGLFNSVYSQLMSKNRVTGNEALIQILQSLVLQSLPRVERK